MDCWSFFHEGRKVRFVLFLCGSQVLLFVSYGKLGFSRPESGESETVCIIVSKARDKEMFIEWN